MVGVWIEVDRSFIDKDGRDESWALRQPISLAWSHIVYEGLRWRLHHILHLSTPKVLISFRTGMGYPAKFYPCSESISDNRKAKVLNTSLPPRSMPLQPPATALSYAPYPFSPTRPAARVADHRHSGIHVNCPALLVVD